MEQQHFFLSKSTQYRAILANSKEVSENSGDSEVVATRWYDKEIPLDHIFAKAKKFEKDLVIIESNTLEQKMYEVK